MHLFIRTHTFVTVTHTKNKIEKKRDLYKVKNNKVKILDKELNFFFLFSSLCNLLSSFVIFFGGNEDSQQLVGH